MLCEIAWKLYVPASWRQYYYLCEDWDEEVPASSEFRLPRMLTEAEWGWKTHERQGSGAVEDLQGGTFEGHPALPEENGAGGAGWLPAEK